MIDNDIYVHTECSDGHGCGHLLTPDEAISGDFDFFCIRHEPEILIWQPNQVEETRVRRIAILRGATGRPE